jgi:hypothetical protein
MKRTLVVALCLMSFSSFAEVKQVDVISGDKVKIQVMDCKSNEQASFKLNDKSGLVTVSCEKARCQAESKSGKYNVYRFQGDECQFNGCNDKAKIVGSFKAETPVLGLATRGSLKKGMTTFLRQSNDCGTIRVFMGGVSGFLEVK